MRRMLRILIPSVGIVAIAYLVIFILSKGEEREVKNLVLTYNRVLQKGYYDLSSGSMEKLTSEGEYKRIDTYMAFLLKSKRALKGEMKKLEFEEVKVAKDSATVVTQERWVYLYVDPATRQPVSETYDVVYGNTYFLKKTKGRWVVDDLVSKEIGGKRER